MAHIYCRYDKTKRLLLLSYCTSCLLSVSLARSMPSQDLHCDYEIRAIKILLIKYQPHTRTAIQYTQCEIMAAHSLIAATNETLHYCFMIDRNRILLQLKNTFCCVAVCCTRQFQFVQCKQQSNLRRRLGCNSNSF